VIVPAYPLEE